MAAWTEFGLLRKMAYPFIIQHSMIIKYILQKDYNSYMTVSRHCIIGKDGELARASIYPIDINTPIFVSRCTLQENRTQIEILDHRIIE